MKNKQIICGIVAVLISSVVKVFAADVGDFIYKKDINSSARIEAIYEKYDRKAKGTIDVTGPSVNLKGIDFDAEGADEKILMARLNLLTSDEATFYLDGGVLDEKDAKSKPFIFGAGVHLIANETEKSRLNIVIAGHYTPSFDLEDQTDYSSTLGYETTTNSKQKGYEIGAGIILSGKNSLNSESKIVPYGGLLFSLMRANLGADMTFSKLSGKHTISADLEEDQSVVAVAGVSFLFQKNLSIRLESRFIGDSSLSFAMGAAF